MHKKSKETPKRRNQRNRTDFKGEKKVLPNSNYIILLYIELNIIKRITPYLISQRIRAGIAQTKMAAGQDQRVTWVTHAHNAFSPFQMVYLWNKARKLNKIMVRELIRLKCLYFQRK